MAGILAATGLALAVSLSVVLVVAFSPLGDDGLSDGISGSVVLSDAPASYPEAIARLREAETPSPSPSLTVAPSPETFLTEVRPPATAEPAAEAPQVTDAPIPRTVNSVPIPTEPPPPPPAPTPPPAPPPPQPQPTPAPLPGSYRNDIADALFALFNSVRSQNGLGAVSANGSLTAAAQGYSLYHFVYHDPYALSHSLDGSPGDRAWRNGYCCGVGEILATAQGSAQRFIDLWMSSPPHRAIILDPQYVSIGVSCYGGMHDGFETILCVADWGNG